MKKVRQLNGWGIFQNNVKEIKEYGFSYTVLTPDNMEYAYMCSPADSDFEFDSLESALNWIKSY